MFDFAGSTIPVRADITAAFEREWDRLAAAGSFWTGPERVAIAREARIGREDPAQDPASDILSPGALEAARALGADPAGRTRSWVESMVAAMGDRRYVELVGVVARGAAIDAFHRTIGADLPELPVPIPGDPDGDHDRLARPGPAWVPMVGGASIVNALSLIPRAARAQEELHGPLYLTYEQMSDLGFQRGLSRAQMELVAARTSAGNECFY